ncbi:hypothetical protein G6L89_007480 [Agrobacterium fabrum]|uniref:hypothetical protein n=1 Tax=Agrobacterium fabrum TaxID=1176649 RepID=UPI001574A4E8|nr:hypothetical protein [Agrobacterium fabrum]NTB07666.1 hypothetical protein [Agrobacterium fabrum]
MEEEESFSNALLIATSAIYIAVVAATFAGLMVTMPTTGEAVLSWIEDFGSIIAGLPVIIAVVVAKQQLEASRTQHEATTRLQFRDELEGLQTALEVARRHKNIAALSLVPFLGPKKIRDSDRLSVSNCKSPHVIESFELLKSIVNDGAKYPAPTGGFMAMLFLRFPNYGGDAAKAANDVINAVKDRKEFLRQFLPTLA